MTTANTAALAPIHMPPASYWPILVAASLLVMMVGFLTKTEQVVIGGLLTLLSIYGFALEYHHKPYGDEVRTSS